MAVKGAAVRLLGRIGRVLVYSVVWSKPVPFCLKLLLEWHDGSQKVCLLGRRFRSRYGTEAELTKNVAIMVAPDNVRVNTICPGPVLTEMAAE